MPGLPDGLVVGTEPVDFARLEGPALEADGQAVEFVVCVEEVEESPPERLDTGAEDVGDALLNGDDEVSELGDVGGSDAPEPPERDAGVLEVEDVLAVEDRGGLVYELLVAREGRDDGGVVLLARPSRGDLEGTEVPVRFDLLVVVEGGAEDLLTDLDGTA